jgi:hypothetical protein
MSQRTKPRKSFGKVFTYQRPEALSPQTGSAAGSSSKDGIDHNGAAAEAPAAEDELKKLRFIRQVSAFDVDIATLEDHPWRSKTVDLLDYFNYGFTERTWLVSELVGTFFFKNLSILIVLFQNFTSNIAKSSSA